MKYQTLFKEYVWLVNTIAKHRRISLEEINQLWVETEMSGGVELARTTFNRHKAAVEDIFGIVIECDRRDGYRYYIGNNDVLEDETIQNWMLQTMTVNNLLSEHKSIHNRILLEAVPSAEGFLGPLMEAMKHNVKVKIFYQKYSDEFGRERQISPFCVKLYRRRWYVLAQIESGEMRTFSLDRIKKMNVTNEKFEIPVDFDAKDYFKDYTGALTLCDHDKERIKVRAYGKEAFYLRDLPIHQSQREIESTDEYTDFEYQLVPTSDFVQLFVARGALVRVMEPQWLANRVKEMFEEAVARYN